MIVGRGSGGGVTMRLIAAIDCLSNSMAVSIKVYMGHK